MRKSFIVALAIVAVLAAVALGRSRARHLAVSSHAASDVTPGKDAGQLKVIRFVKNPMVMPPFLVNDLDGRVISTADFRGKVVILNFWATWCPPCREEIPELVDLANRYKDRLIVIGVSKDDGPSAAVRGFARKIGINYPIVMNSREIEEPYGGVDGLPTSFIINKEGRVVQKHQGLYPIDVYEGEIRSLLGMPVDAKVETFEDTGQIFLKNSERATELPDVDFKGLTPEQKKLALKRLNSEGCTCGCKLTIAQCRINDSTCETSKALAEKIVAEIKSGRPASPPATTIKQ